MYYLIITLMKILNALPLGAALFIGRVAGRFLYLDSKRRSLAFKNAKLAFPEKSHRKVKRIIRRSFLHFGMNIIESLLLPKLDAHYVEKYMDLTEWDKIRQTPQIFAGIHQGSWEVFNSSLAIKGKYAVLAQQQKDKRLDDYLNGLRRKNDLGVCFSLKSLMKYIKEGYWVGSAVDHGAESNAEFVEFFGKKVPVAGGLVLLAKRTKRNIYPSFIVRTNTKYHCLKIGREVSPDDGEALLKINRTFEEFLRAWPHEYLWWHKRFKRKKTFDILLISDGKPGHLKQSRVFAEAFKSFGLEVNTRVVEPQYKNRLSGHLTFACALTSSQVCVGCARCLRALLKKESFHELERTYADIVVSAGNTVAPTNLITARSLGAKSVVILKPDVPLGKFDLAIVPEHDGIEGRNVVTIKGALTKVDLSDVSRCREAFALSDDKKVSVFIGGPLTHPEFFFSNVKLFMDKLKSFVHEHDYRVLLSTSRRTPQAVEDYLDKELTDWQRVEKVIIARRENYDFVTAGFMGLSDIVFTSAESISMISEALSFKKKTVAVAFESIERRRQVSFLNSCQGEGLIKLIHAPYTIGVVSEPSVDLEQFNAAKLKDAIGRLL